MQKFLRLSLIVAIGLSCSWHAREARSAGSTTKLPPEIPLKIDGGMPTIELIVNGKGHSCLESIPARKVARASIH